MDIYYLITNLELKILIDYLAIVIIIIHFKATTAVIKIIIIIIRVIIIIIIIITLVFISHLFLESLWQLL
jgi:hypothetical protein